MFPPTFKPKDVLSVSSFCRYWPDSCLLRLPLCGGHPCDGEAASPTEPGCYPPHCAHDHRRECTPRIFLIKGVLTQCFSIKHYQSIIESSPWMEDLYQRSMLQQWISVFVCVFGATGEQSSLHPHHSASHEDPQVQGGCCQRQRQDVAHYHRYRCWRSICSNDNSSEAFGIVNFTALRIQL